jgi:anthranilate synthase component 1
VDYSGNMDTAITIRTILVKDDALYLQAGAGIVADSEAEAEYQETMSKARALIQAIDLAREGED